MKRSEFTLKLAHIIEGATTFPVVGAAYVDIDTVVKEMETQKLIEPPPYEPFPGSEMRFETRQWEPEDV